MDIFKTYTGTETSEEAIILLEILAESGHTWSGGASYTNYSNWHIFKQDTCYSSSGGYSDINYYEKQNYTIFRFRDIYNKPKYFISKLDIKKFKNDTAD